MISYQLSPSFEAQPILWKSFKNRQRNVITFNGLCKAVMFVTFLFSRHIRKRKQVRKWKNKLGLLVIKYVFTYELYIIIFWCFQIYRHIFFMDQSLANLKGLLCLWLNVLTECFEQHYQLWMIKQLKILKNWQKVWRKWYFPHPKNLQKTNVFL